MPPGKRHPKSRRPVAAISAALLLLLSLAVAARRSGLGHGHATTPEPLTAAHRVPAIVLDVVDGDTIRVDIDGHTYSVRYIGIDAPELRPTIEPYGVAATEANERLVAGQTVLLESDVSDTDRYGRLLRYVWVGDILVNEELVRQGVARAGHYPPDLRYDERLRGAEDGARAAGLGLWSAGTAAAPQDAVSACPGGCATPPAGCAIKGNVNADGRRLYHLPSAATYEDTCIDPSRGERWFCSVVEAEAAGWLPAR